MTKLLFWGNIQVFAGKEKTDEDTWTTHNQETLTSMLTNALLNATTGDLKTVVPFTLKQTDFSNYDERDFTYLVKCLVEVDESNFINIRDFYVIGIPSFDYHVEENIDPKHICGEFYIE